MTDPAPPLTETELDELDELDRNHPTTTANLMTRGLHQAGESGGDTGENCPEEKAMNEDHRDFAIQAHGAQRYGEHPYVYHLDQVAELCWPYGERAVAVAYLHDVLEDTATKFEGLAAAFSYDLARHVEALTDPAGATRAERKVAFYEYFRVQTCRVCPIVKACDRLANVRECIKNNPSLLTRYRAEHTEFRSAVFRAGLCDTIWTELDGICSEAR